MSGEPIKGIEVFYSYAHQDEPLRNELEKHLTILKRQGYITSWYDRKIIAGAEWAREIDTHLNMAQIILLLISPDFMASDYCYDIEMKRALERHEAGEAWVIPVILRPIDWKNAPFGKLEALPPGGKPIASWSGRHGRDKAFLEVTLRLREVIKAISEVQRERETTASGLYHNSVNLRIASIHSLRANTLYGLKRHAEALAIYEEALRLDPNDAVTHSGKGDVLYELKRYTEALDAYDHMISLDPNDTLAYYGKKNTLQRLGRY